MQRNGIDDMQRNGIDDMQRKSIDDMQCKSIDDMQRIALMMCTGCKCLCKTRLVDF